MNNESLNNTDIVSVENNNEKDISLEIPSIEQNEGVSGNERVYGEAVANADSFDEIADLFLEYADGKDRVTVLGAEVVVEDHAAKMRTGDNTEFIYDIYAKSRMEDLKRLNGSMSTEDGIEAQAEKEKMYRITLSSANNFDDVANRFLEHANRQDKVFVAGVELSVEDQAVKMRTGNTDSLYDVYAINKINEIKEQQAKISEAV